MVIVLAGCGRGDPITDSDPGADPGSPEDPNDAVAADPVGDAVVPSAFRELDPALIERGAYLDLLAGCLFCHTPWSKDGVDYARSYQGGGTVREPWGTWTQVNITGGPKTGVGDWSDAELVTALRAGVRPDGSRVAPIMPWSSYAALADSDAAALVEFLRSFPPTESESAHNRELELDWKAVPTKAGGAKPPTDPVALGEYLATLMRCADCHTPRTANGRGGPDPARAWQGDREFFAVPFEEGTGSLFSTNLTSHEATGLGGWSDAEIVTAIREGRSRDGSLIRGPMGRLTASWSRMTDEDVATVVAFLRTIPPKASTIRPATYVLPMEAGRK
jgi:mono/diheme cytochrome c family protein